jgi:hypothetical protein
MNQCFGVARIELVHAAETLLRLFRAARFALHKAEVVERGQVVRRQRQRTAVGRDGALEIALRLERIAEILEGFGFVSGPDQIA